MITIVNVNESWGIGKDNDLLANFPEDMKYFREKTRGKIIVCGLNTLKSYPGMKPLKGRINIVLTEALDMIPMESIKACDCYVDDLAKASDTAFMTTPGATVMIAVTNLYDLLDIVSLFNGDDVFVCGGASVYRLLLPYCDKALITINDCKREADTFFPDLTKEEGWELSNEGELLESTTGIKYRFNTYTNKNA
ncbi:MAG: dihydrofolate reductase [Eubacteriales bacterium]|nr:dihydrofolate reductase [Eubacteriales bacterium]